MITRNGNRAAIAGIWRRVALAGTISIMMLVVIRAQAQEQTSLPEITVTPPLLPPKSLNAPDRNGNGDGKTPGDAKARDGRALDRLNEQLKRKVDETNPIGNTPPLDARSPDTKTGIVNIPGVQQQYGRNFGNSVIPYRPGPPVYAPPLGHR